MHSFAPFSHFRQKLLARYLECDLKTLDWEKEFGAEGFDVVLLDPPWEEYAQLLFFDPGVRSLRGE